MRRMKLPLELFDHIIHIADGSRKSDYISDYIKERDTILIGNLFLEREGVHERFAAYPCFTKKTMMATPAFALNDFR
jgi:hypothetical protein